MKKIGEGKRDYIISKDKRGRYFKSTLQVKKGDIALDATIRSACINQYYRDKKNNKILVKPNDYRYKLRKNKIGNLIVFVVDSSGSMGAQSRMKSVKGAIMSLLLDSYQKRDKVSMISFRQKNASVLLNPTNSVELANNLLRTMETGGTTPLSDGLNKAYEMVTKEIDKDKNLLSTIVLISDCKANKSQNGNNPLKESKEIAKKIAMKNINTICIDVEKKNMMSLNLCQEICECMNGRYFEIKDLKEDKIIKIIKDELGV